MQEVETPQIGDVVHYITYGSADKTFKTGERRAAIVTDVPSKEQIERPQQSPWLSLCVLNPSGCYFIHDVPYDPRGEKGGTWLFRESK